MFIKKHTALKSLVEEGIQSGRNPIIPKNFENLADATLQLETGAIDVKQFLLKLTHVTEGIFKKKKKKKKNINNNRVIDDNLEEIAQGNNTNSSTGGPSNSVSDTATPTRKTLKNSKINILVNCQN